MPVVHQPGKSAAVSLGGDWVCQMWAGPRVFGAEVGMDVWRYTAEPYASPAHPLNGSEGMAYVISGSGTVRARLVDEQLPLSRESVVWLGGPGMLAFDAGGDGLDLLVAGALAPGATGPSSPRSATVFAAAELPHLVSTRDTRDRLDLVTENVPVGARAIRADRIVYHPGDTAAAHYHTDCHHVFCVLAGSGLLYTGEEANRLRAGDSALVGPGEVHWFENDTGENFSFVEFWAPPPAETVWTVAGDRCTWAPAG
jgi:quercetin dioxygenase-like cupin family protein